MLSPLNNRLGLHNTAFKESKPGHSGIRSGTVLNDQTGHSKLVMLEGRLSKCSAFQAVFSSVSLCRDSLLVNLCNTVLVGKEEEASKWKSERVKGKTRVFVCRLKCTPGNFLNVRKLGEIEYLLDQHFFDNLFIYFSNHKINRMNRI